MNLVTTCRELRREFRMAGEKESFVHHWYTEWGFVFGRKIQQNALFAAEGKLFTLGGRIHNINIAEMIVFSTLFSKPVNRLAISGT